MKKKIVIGLMIMAMSAQVFAGCGKKDGEGSTSSNTSASNDVVVVDALVDIDEAKSSKVLTIENTDITVQDIYIYALEYFFSNNVDPTTIDETKYQEIIDKIIEEIKVEVVQAELAKVTDGIEITEEQKETIDVTATQFYNYFGAEFMAKYGIDYDCAYALFERQMYIDLLRAKSMNDMKEDYLEEYSTKYENLDFFSLYYVLFPSIKYENGQPVTADDGSYVTLSEEELEEQLDLAKELQKKAIDNQKDGDVSGDMENLAKEYGVDYASDIERGYTGAYSEELNAVIEELEDGDISDVIETEAGYMIVRMDNKNDEDFKAYSIDAMAARSAETLFPTLQSNWLKGSGVESVEVANDLLEGLKLKELCQEMKDKGLNQKTGGNN